MPSLTNVKWEIDISVASFSLSRYCCTLPEPRESGDIKKTHFTFPTQAHSMLPVNLPYDWCLYLLPPKSHCIFPNHKILYQVVSRYLKLWSWCQTNIIFFCPVLRARELTAFMLPFHRDTLVVQTVKNLPAVQEPPGQSLSWEDPLEKEMATHSSILA